MINSKEKDAADKLVFVAFSGHSFYGWKAACVSSERVRT